MMFSMLAIWDSCLYLDPSEPIFTIRCEDAEKCWLQVHRERDYGPPYKKYHDAERSKQSRFAGTLVRMAWRLTDRVAYWPYERVRTLFVADIVHKLQSRMYTATRLYDRPRLPCRPCDMATKFLGCTESELIERFESLMQPGMDWTNCGLGGWQIDHIRPLSSFNLYEIEQVSIACHADNLRPCWEKENLSKNAKLPTQGG